MLHATCYMKLYMYNDWLRRDFPYGFESFIGNDEKDPDAVYLPVLAF